MLRLVADTISQLVFFHTQQFASIHKFKTLQCYNTVGYTSNTRAVTVVRQNDVIVTQCIVSLIL